MTAASLIDAKVIMRFLRAQQFRHPATSENYAGTQDLSQSTAKALHQLYRSFNNG
jgi:hypothetical protein